MDEELQDQTGDVIPEEENNPDDQLTADELTALALADQMLKYDPARQPPESSPDEKGTLDAAIPEWFRKAYESI